MGGRQNTLGEALNGEGGSGGEEAANAQGKHQPRSEADMLGLERQHGQHDAGGATDLQGC